MKRPPGGICLSEDIARPIRNKLEFPLVDLGEKRLKNITDPLRVFAVGLPWLSEDDLKLAGEKFRSPAAAVLGSGWLAGYGDRRVALRRGVAAALTLIAIVLSAIVFWPFAATLR